MKLPQHLKMSFYYLVKPQKSHFQQFIIVGIRSCNWTNSQNMQMFLFFSPLRKFSCICSRVSSHLLCSYPVTLSASGGLNMLQFFLLLDFYRFFDAIKFSGFFLQENPFNY